MTAAPGPRVLAAVGALAAGVLLLVLHPAAELERGCPGTAVAAALAAMPLVAFLGLLAAAPLTLQRVLTRWTRVDLRDAGHVGASVVFAFTLYFLLGYGGLVTGTSTVEGMLPGACPRADPLAPTPDGLVQAVIVSAALFTLPTLLYVGIVHGLGPAGTLRALGFRGEDAPRAIGIGAGLAFAFLLGLGILVAALSPFLPENALDNETALAIARSVTPLSALILALGSGFGEEIFFRGFLQQRIGLLATSVVFALAHANYGSVSEVAVVFLLSLAMGFAFRVTGNLWTAVAAHFTFNLVQLFVGMYAGDMAG